ncbi:WecB/TagA/CpsF family glycosyltransferase [Ramlibacter sp. XY19]|uniref:WecB/TagA/CpsF family glycosyltransferase n=1 Tax=Ramlibacter paludis TaxID=2908000 RepID=UPI0023DC88C0|nr:WecB/TagA/CpsF family glycosyltransferase [Ramlibacter paludis]MCG2592025.1 WecB/TagA/CpsF family glycosyltransferase [Ramlibacter paludis]
MWKYGTSGKIAGLTSDSELTAPMQSSVDSPPRRLVEVQGTPIDALTWSEAIGTLIDWGRSRRSRYVCICNVHSVVTAQGDAMFSKVLKEADLVTPDGAPVAWTMRRKGFPGQDRINGPDLMWKYLAEAERHKQIVFFYGGQESTLERLRAAVLQAYPTLLIGGMISPPFRTMTTEEDDVVVETVNASGASVVFVSLGCPKQEFWMAAHRPRVKGVMIGVGAAFDYHAGSLKRAPEWMRAAGLEWLHRLASEPRRLWRRYASTNTRFIVGVLSEAAKRPSRTKD